MILNLTRDHTCKYSQNHHCTRGRTIVFGGAGALTILGGSGPCSCCSLTAGRKLLAAQRSRWCNCRYQGHSNSPFWGGLAPAAAAVAKKGLVSKWRGHRVPAPPCIVCMLCVVRVRCVCCACCAAARTRQVWLHCGGVTWTKQHPELCVLCVCGVSWQQQTILKLARALFDFNPHLSPPPVICSAIK